MELLEFADLLEGALLLIDSAPIIYVLEEHPQLGPRFAVNIRIKSGHERLRQTESSE